VQLQGYRNFEHVVVDGGSTDGTVDLLRNMTATESGRKTLWMSEPDTGQSEALNKGFRQARGEIIGWLNADDRYRAECLQHIVRAFHDNPDVDIVYGDYVVISECGKVVKVRREIEYSEFILHYHRVLYIPTTATFFRRRVFEEQNWIDERLQYAMDLDFFIRLSQRGYRFRHVRELLADFRMQPNSKTCSAPESQRREHQQVVRSRAPLPGWLRSTAMGSVALAGLGCIASARRCTEKLLRGYYCEQGTIL
jgi:glycosyltransferase involved in cell wall biosynthesis